MNRNYFYLVLAATLCSVLLILFSFWKNAEEPKSPEYFIKPPLSPFKSYISGVGVVQPVSGNIQVGTPVNRIIEKVFVTVGEKVKKGDILFKLENKDLMADLLVKQMAYKSAKARLQKLEALPHPEDLASAEAALQSAQTEMNAAKSQFDMVLSLPDSRAISQEESDRRYFRYQQAKDQYREAEAKFEKVKSGTWKPDLEIANYETMFAKANVTAIQTDIQRTIIRSPIDGTVLQIKIHEGEFSVPSNARTPIMIIGDTTEMYLRVSINQLEVAYFSSTAPAVAFLQGDASHEFPLEFVRIEPFLVAKEDLTNEINEKVDTQIFQIVYKIAKSDPHIFVGARMDVFIERELSK
ncbi:MULTISPECIES: HlyD family secretion protein [Parachlamydia]|jgi:multidrug resistance efflux pump|uniref:HlyD family secretion protein n=1 Tax=Parachlamydia TaxID=83551 RepID=UPI0001C17A55|nr:HlyD family efflux transporter periplasmic adaptor subunit [Parachlamydia acanthamoebae]EFB42287.1 hypothetical protein pah_c013o058 [Parachlamydia acanthamoebae str. Hall's coccus]